MMTREYRDVSFIEELYFFLILIFVEDVGNGAGEDDDNVLVEMCD